MDVIEFAELLKFYYFGYETQGDRYPEEEPDFCEILGDLVIDKPVNFFYEGIEHTVVCVDSYGGEGRGDEYWEVYSMDGHFFKIEAFYSSWSGVNWAEASIYPVEPREVTVTQYFSTGDATCVYNL